MPAYILILTVVMNFGCMQRVLSETEREHWSVKGMEQSMKFQWCKMAEQLLSFYKQLLKE